MRTYRNLPAFAAGAAGLFAGLVYHKVSTNRPYLISAATPINLDVDSIISKDLKDYVKRYVPMMKHGFPSHDTLRLKENFVLSYDRRNRVPNWVMEHLTSSRMEKESGVTRKSSNCRCYEDRSIHEYFRSTLTDYKDSGYDKGHLAAAANHKHSLEAYEETYVLSNITPQNKYFNQRIWQRLEDRVRKLVIDYGSVFVCSGPLYLPRNIKLEEEQLFKLTQEPQKNRKRRKTNSGKESSHNPSYSEKKYVIYEVIGPNDVAVPTHFFKIMLCEIEKNKYDMEAYIIPNEHVDPSKPLSDFMVEQNEIERTAGFLLFNELPRNSLRSINGERCAVVDSPMEDSYLESLPSLYE